MRVKFLWPDGQTQTEPEGVNLRLHTAAPGAPLLGRRGHLLQHDRGGLRGPLPPAAGSHPGRLSRPHTDNVLSCPEHPPQVGPSLLRAEVRCARQTTHHGNRWPHGSPSDWAGTCMPGEPRGHLWATWVVGATAAGRQPPYPLPPYSAHQATHVDLPSHQDGRPTVTAQAQVAWTVPPLPPPCVRCAGPAFNY